MLPQAVANTVRAAAHADDSAAVFQPADNVTRPVRPDDQGLREFLAAGQTVGNRYHVIRLIGVGGMGSVYQAWDAELGIAVALKTIHPVPTGDPAAGALERRLKRELLLARKITHKHVVRIHDLGEINGVKYLTMPYIAGGDLAGILRDRQRLPLARALRYVRQIASGLAAAHDVGVVHRDLKPANIMIDEDDQALIMDFGIAQSELATTSSMAGIVGTLAYMAPEQAQAQPTDQRTDIYSLGMIFREMLIGPVSAAHGESAITDVMKRVHEAPARVQSIDDSIPDAIDRLIARCLEPDPARRFQTTAELIRALDGLDDSGRPLPAAGASGHPRIFAGIGIAIAVLVIVAGWFAWSRTAGGRTVAGVIAPVSVLIADFENRANDHAFDGALEQPFAIALEEASFITAYPRRDALRLATELKAAHGLDSATARLVAFREGVKYVLAGSVSATGSGFSLGVQAIEPASGSVVRSAASSAKSKADVLTALGAVARQLRIGLGETADSVAARPAAETFTAGSLESFREYSAAQDLATAGRDEEAVDHYRRAIAFDPAFGRAYSGLAVSAQRLGHPQESEVAWQKALSLIDRMTEREKYRTLGAYYLAGVQNYEKAAESFTALVHAYPSDSAGYGNLALAHFYLRDFSRALGEGRQAVAINPRSVLQRSNLALYAMYAGDFAAAAREARNALAEQPSHHVLYLPVAIEALAKGDAPGAVRAYDAMAATGARGASLASIGRADLLMYTGRADAARAELQTGLAADMSSGNTTGAALKQVALAELEAEAGRVAQASAAATSALERIRQIATIVPAARALVQVHQTTAARARATELAAQLQRQGRAYGKIVLAEIALEEGKTTEAADRLNEALQLADVWLGRFDLGVTYVQAGHFAEALPELELCEKRRGEATALFFDDVPTYRYLAPLPYWIGRAQEGLGMRDAAVARYQSYLTVRAESTADPLAADARRRVASR